MFWLYKAFNTLLVRAALVVRTHASLPLPLPIKERWYLVILKGRLLWRKWVLVMFWKRHILSKEGRRKKKKKHISLFNYPRLLHLFQPPTPKPPQVCFQRERSFSLARQHSSLSFFPYLPGHHFYAWNTEVDWKHSAAIQTMKKEDPQSFIRYEDLQ